MRLLLCASLQFPIVLLIGCPCLHPGAHLNVRLTPALLLLPAPLPSSLCITHLSSAPQPRNIKWTAAAAAGGGVARVGKAGTGKG